MATCRNCVHSCVCFDCEGTTRYYGKELAADNVEQLCRNYKDRARFVELPLVAMVEQSLQCGEMKPEKDQRFNGRYAVVYSDKKKWGTPLIDICGGYYNPDEAEERKKALIEKAEKEEHE